MTSDTRRAALAHPDIIEIWGRTVQGMTRPFRCGTDDGHAYYVKSRGAGWRSLVCEWVAGSLAQDMGLPVAHFAQVSLDQGMADVLRFKGEHDLVAGLSFGSRIATHTREFEPSLLMQCDEQFRRDLVAFDWWVRNADRTLGVLSGNPNLLWDPKAEAPVVIDHNMAFDCDFDAEQFLQTHVFRADLEMIAGDPQLRSDYELRFACLLNAFSEIWAQLPENWVFDEDDQPRVDPNEFRAVLERIHHPGFWPRFPDPTRPAHVT